MGVRDWSIGLIALHHHHSQKNIIGYSFPQEIRRNFAFRYKPNFGNLVNNVVQRLIAETIWTSEKSVTSEWDRDYQKNFDKELKQIKDKPPVDAKDKFAREEMLNYAHGLYWCN